MLSRENNELLARVEDGMPMGALMRRYWHPILLSQDLAAAGAPRRVRVLGENYVAFRDSDGQVGVLDESCPHRGASLVLARNEDCALQCLYHGWRIDRAGRVLETPSEPGDSTFKDRIRHPAYAVREAGGLIWAYFGPADEEPRFPSFEWTGHRPEQVYTLRVLQRCNWAQAFEGAIDTSHLSFLHNNLMRRLAGGGDYTGGGGLLNKGILDLSPRHEVDPLPYGFHYAGIREAITEDGQRAQYVRTTQFVAPYWAMFASTDVWWFGQAFVPVDDYNTLFYFVHGRLDGATIDEDERGRIKDWSGIGELDDDFHMEGHVGNTWNQDRRSMDRKRWGGSSSFSGLRGNQAEDLAIQESMGPIYDRTREHLGSSDLAISRFRRFMIDAASRDAQGEGPAPALGNDFEYGEIRAGEALIGADEPWQTAVGNRGQAQVDAQ